MRLLFFHHFLVIFFGTLRIRLIVIYFSCTYFHRSLFLLFQAWKKNLLAFISLHVTRDLFIIGVSHTVSAERKIKSLSTDWHVHEMNSGLLFSCWTAKETKEKDQQYFNASPTLWLRYGQINNSPSIFAYLILFSRVWVFYLNMFEKVLNMCVLTQYFFYIYLHINEAKQTTKSRFLNTFSPFSWHFFFRSFRCVLFVLCKLNECIVFVRSFAIYVHAFIFISFSCFRLTLFEYTIECSSKETEKTHQQQS